MGDTHSPENTTRVAARDHIDPDGSVVRSGMALADAVLQALETGRVVEVSLDGLRGASSSYFNVFLRRIDEACGVAELGEHIQMLFASKVQEMVYLRSLDSVRRGAKKSPVDPPTGPQERRQEGPSGNWKSRLAFWKRSRP